MSKASRDAILDKLRGAARRDGDEASARDAVDARLRTHARGTIPARGKLDRMGLMDLFAAQATAVDATVARVAAPDDVPAILKPLLARKNVRRAPGSAGEINTEGTPHPQHFHLEYDV